MSEEQHHGDVDLLASGPERGDRGSGSSRWVWRIAGLLVLGIVAVVAGPNLLSSPKPHPKPAAARPGQPSRVAPTVVGVEPAAVPPLDWVARGPAIGSRFADAALARMRAQRQGVDRLLWAGSLDGHDHVVVVSYRRQPNYPGDPIEVAALRVRRIRDIGRADSQTIGFVGQVDGLVGLGWTGEDKHTRLLVLGRPAPTVMPVQVSVVVDYHRDGQVSRRWRGAELNDGVLVTDLGRRVDPVIAVRPKLGTTGTSPILVNVDGRPEMPGADEVTVAGVSAPSYAGPPARKLVASLAQAVRPLFDLRDADSTVLWSGRIRPGVNAAARTVAGRGALVLVRRHDGATFQAFAFIEPGDIDDTPQALAVRWSVADRLPYAFSPPESDGQVELINPSGPGSIALSSGFLVKKRVEVNDNGVGTLSGGAGDLDGAGVVVLDSAGRVVLRSHLPSPDSVDPLRTYL